MSSASTTPSIESLQEALEVANETYESAVQDFDDDPTEESENALTAASRALRLAKKAVTDAEAAASTELTATLSGIGKTARSMTFASGTTVEALVRSAGWNTEQVTYGILNSNGSLTTVPGNQVLTTSVSLQVIAKSNAG